MTSRSELTKRNAGPVRFRSTRERSLWILGIAAAFAGAWAVAQQVGWPVAARAVLAALAAFAVVLIPEVRLRRARADRAAQNLRRLEALTPDGHVQFARDASLDSLRVHDASKSVPYVRRDVERLFNAALIARSPVLLVGHSMAGRLASRPNALRPPILDHCFWCPLRLPYSEAWLRMSSCCETL
jgi:hypothetical protein